MLASVDGVVGVGVCLAILLTGACGRSAFVGAQGEAGDGATDAGSELSEPGVGADSGTSVDADGERACSSVFDWTRDCFAADAFEGDATLPADCSCCAMERLCPVVQMDCPREGSESGCDWWRDGVVQDEATARCALEALRDAQPGLLQIEGAEIGGEGARNLWIVDRQTVVILEVEAEQDGGGRIDYVAAANPASYFEACLNEADPIVFTACLFDGLRGRGDELEFACPSRG